MSKVAENFSTSALSCSMSLLFTKALLKSFNSFPCSFWIFKQSSTALWRNSPICSKSFSTRSHGLFQGNGKSTNLVIVRTALERGEDSKVDLVFEIIHCIFWLPFLGRFWAFAVEYHTGPRSPKTLF
ncbi:hypothetical protein Leryth_020584 [Lithospermum erythrorhizon]|nr:hypothetical protein Leryth_020584 [Lithospermum erythrorhizon]